MECPKCRGKIIDNCCIRCGSMINGTVISLNDKKDKNEDIKIYQKNFDTMLRNNNWYISFLIGPLYISYKGHLLLGSILTYIDLSLYILTLMVPSFLPQELLVIPFFNQLGIYLFVFYFIISKLLYAATFNSLCLKLDEKKIEKLKRKKPKNYKKILIKHTNHILYPIISILLLILFIFILIIIRRIENGTINEFIFWL